MDPSLRLLLHLRFRGWLRRLGRMLQTVKGILLAVFGFLVFAPCIFSAVLMPLLSPQSRPQTNPEDVKLYGTLGLLAYCVSVLVFSTGERAISFTPAEVNFLFSGPFTRRQLLVYKLVVTLLNSLIGTLFFTLFCRTYASNFFAAYVGLMLAMMFLQLFAMTVAFIANTAGLMVYNRWRKLVLAVMAIMIVLTVLYLSRDLPLVDWRELLGSLAQSAGATVSLTPLRWFVEAFTAQRFWPDLVQYAALGVAVNGALLALVFFLDAQYLETAATASERLYARLQRLRSGGPAAHWNVGGKVRFTLPALPWLGGAGPIAWRQLLTAFRSLKGIVFFLLIVGLSALWPMLLRANDHGHGSEFGIGLASGLLAMTLFLLPSIVPFDFRGDIDRMDVLKSLPLRPITIVVGELVSPVILGSGIQLVLLVVIQAVAGEGVGQLVAAVSAAFVLPFNFLVFSLENLVFLLFPTRIAPATAGDFQLVGRHMVLFWMKFLVLLLTAGTIALLATLVYLLSGASWPATLVAAWLLLAGVDVTLLWPLTLAFRKFDVARDTPP